MARPMTRNPVKASAAAEEGKTTDPAQEGAQTTASNPFASPFGQAPRPTGGAGGARRPPKRNQYAALI
eukprot:CAMPEP_0170457800 /NCGR_PEP_ID=MMETSP0123-20130129/4964_1 /TAXON_ID=182087 /ORGANISM="Favella ehrenbergii, Strain Fehren 1" /LENGTH=67 /DNA_ID=CAMNT_0010721699 /DNA_START=4299 /DNA_END=4502 /DNA_ORIENTATION=-